MEKECCKDCLDREVLPINSKLIPRERCGNSNCRCHSLPQKDKRCPYHHSKQPDCDYCENSYISTRFVSSQEQPKDIPVGQLRDKETREPVTDKVLAKDYWKYHDENCNKWEMWDGLRWINYLKQSQPNEQDSDEYYRGVGDGIINGRSQERQLLREKIEGMVWPNVQKGEKFESGYNSALSDLLDYLNTEQ